MVADGLIALELVRKEAISLAPNLPAAGNCALS